MQVDCLPQSLDVGAAGPIEEVELPHLLEILLELGQVRMAPWPRRGGLPLERLHQLAVARGELPVVGVAGLLEQANDVRAAHVLDLIDAEQDRLAPLALDLLTKPLELLVIVRSVRKEVHRALQGDGAQGPKAAPHADAQAGRGGRKAYYAQEELGIHSFTYETTVSLPCQAVNDPWAALAFGERAATRWKPRRRR